MGTTASFKCLSMLNYACARAAERRHGIRRIRFRICGDDILAVWPKRVIETYLQNCASIGFLANPTKQTKSRIHGVFCERMYCVKEGILQFSSIQTQSIKTVLHSTTNRVITGYCRPSRIVRICSSDLDQAYKTRIIRGLSIHYQQNGLESLPYEFGGIGLSDGSRRVRNLPSRARKILTGLLNDTARTYASVVKSQFIDREREESYLHIEDPVPITRACQHNSYVGFKTHIRDQIEIARSAASSAPNFCEYRGRIRRLPPRIPTCGCLVGCNCDRCVTRRKGKSQVTLGEIIRKVKRNIAVLVCQSKEYNSESWIDLVRRLINGRALHVCALHGIKTAAVDLNLRNNKRTSGTFHGFRKNRWNRMLTLGEIASNLREVD